MEKIKVQLLEKRRVFRDCVEVDRVRDRRVGVGSGRGSGEVLEVSMSRGDKGAREQELLGGAKRTIWFWYQQRVWPLDPQIE